MTGNRFRRGGSLCLAAAAKVVVILGSSPTHERRRGGSGVHVFATADTQRGPSLGAGAVGAGFAGAGRDASPPGFAGGAGRDSDGAAPVVVGVLDWLLLVCSVRLYPIATPTITRMATSAASHQGHIDARLLAASRSRRRGRSERRGSEGQTCFSSFRLTDAIASIDPNSLSRGGVRGSWTESWGRAMAGRADLNGEPYVRFLT